MNSRLALVAVLAVAAPAAAAVVWTASGVFQGAPAGVAVHFEAITLPAVAFLPGERPHPAATGASAFHPTLEQLLMQETIITNDDQMKYIWGRLFATPYDATLFDFNNSFIVMMGGGPLSYAFFGIASVERVDAEYPSFGFGWPGSSTEVDPFLSVTATTFFPGVQPTDPPPGVYTISAVKISKELFDDVVYHRNYVYGV